MVPAAGLKIINPLRNRQDEHHHDNGHRSESLEGKRHTICFIGDQWSPSLDKVRLNLFHSYGNINIFP
jgi:hypothetical protein